MARVLKREKWLHLPYLGDLSPQLTCILRPVGYRLVFDNLNTLYKLPIPGHEKSGVYKITCGN